MKKMLIALAIVVICVSLLGSYQKKEPSADNRTTKAADPTIESQQIPVDATVRQQATTFDVVPDEAGVKEKTSVPDVKKEAPEPDAKQEYVERLAQLNEEVLHDIAAPSMDEQILIFSKVVQNLSEISTTALNTQKALLSVDLNNNAESSTAPESKREKDNGIR